MFKFRPMPYLLSSSDRNSFSESFPVTDINSHFAPKEAICAATIAAPPINFLLLSSFTTTTGASALMPIASQAAY